MTEDLNDTVTVNVVLSPALSTGPLVKSDTENSIASFKLFVLDIVFKRAGKLPSFDTVTSYVIASPGLSKVVANVAVSSVKFVTSFLSKAEPTIFL